MKTQSVCRVAFISALASLPVFALTLPVGTEQISVPEHVSGTLPANQPTHARRISADGSVVIFSSAASDLVPNDTNEREDVFAFIRATEQIERISVSSSGAQANADSTGVLSSANGRYVAFVSAASNLVSGDTNAHDDIFIRDRVAHTTVRVALPNLNLEPDGRLVLSDMTPDARFLVIGAPAPQVPPNTFPYDHVYVLDRQSGALDLISVNSAGEPADFGGQTGVISADGRYVAFVSSSHNLSPDGSGQWIYVRDRQAHTTTRVSENSNGDTPISDNFIAASGSSNPAISADGRYVAFESDDTNLVAHDTNNERDIFLHDRQTHMTTRVSVDSNGNQTDSRNPYVTDQEDLGNHGPTFIGGNSRYIGFQSFATNIAPFASFGTSDAIVHDNQTGETKRLVLTDTQYGASIGGDSFMRLDAQPSFSADGRYIVFTTYSEAVPLDTNENPDIYLRDLQGATTELISRSRNEIAVADNESFVRTGGAVSDDGRYVVFTSSADNLVAGTKTGRFVYLRDRQNKTNKIVSLNSSGQPLSGTEARISGSGRYVAFEGAPGQFVSGDTVAVDAIYVRDLQASGNQRVTIGLSNAKPNGASSNPAITQFGRYVAFTSAATNLVTGDSNGFSDVFVYDRTNNTTALVSLSTNGTHGNGASYEPAISDDGRYVAFTTVASNLGGSAQDTSVYLRDRVNHSTTLISANASSASISGDGRLVAYTFLNTSGERQYTYDVLVYDRTTGKRTYANVDSVGLLADGVSTQPSISREGRYIAFYSEASGLDPYDPQTFRGIFARDRISGATTFISHAPGGSAMDAASSPSIVSGGALVVFGGQSVDPLYYFRIDNVFARARRNVTIYRINCGGGTYTDTLGRQWSADTHFNTGSTNTFTSAIANTNDDVLYQSERWDADSQPEIKYQFAVPNGSYTVRLHFAENYYRNYAPGARVFKVYAQDVLRIPTIDVFREAGGPNIALVKSLDVTVTNGQLCVMLGHIQQNPIIDALEIIQH